ncbi:MAG: hypothetical protein HY319_16210 [Armatimonadetes bacterium]|nr:hypothetical protein [Armatimonadota bacterium]
MEITNAGDQTAEAVQLAVELKQRDQAVETSEIVVDFLPPGSIVKAYACFQRPPETAALNAGCRGFAFPETHPAC